MAEKKLLTAAQEADWERLWKKLVKLYHRVRFAYQPDKLESYAKLTSAINRAKDNGDIKPLRDAGENPQARNFFNPGFRGSISRERTQRSQRGTAATEEPRPR